MSSLPSVLEVRKRIEKTPNPDIKFGLMYLFLIAGDLSEAFGKNSPTGDDATLVSYEFDDDVYEAVLFKSKKVPRKKVGRAVAIPYDIYYEPWAKPLFEYFQDHKRDHIFGNFIEDIKPITFTRYITDELLKIFVGFPCFKNDYQVPFSAICLKDVRIKNLREFYLFQDLDLSLLSFTHKYVELNKPNKEIIRRITSKENSLSDLKNYAEEYFGLLLKPFEKMSDAHYDPVLEGIRYVSVVKRHSKALDICNYIAGTNSLSQQKLGTPFFNENMRFVIRLFNKCSSQNDFMASLSSLAALFETNMDVLNTKLGTNEKSISVIKSYLENNEIDYNDEMLETWKKSVRLRNMEPTHYNIDGKVLGDLYSFFGEDLSFPQNYEILWSKILDKFFNSLIMWNQILNKI